MTAFMLAQDRPRMDMDPASLRIMLIVDAFMFLTMVPITFFVRSAIFRRNQTNGLIRPASYSTGNLIFWAGCEGPSFFALIIAFLHSSFWPSVIITALAMAAQIATFPKLSAIQAPNESFKID